MSELILKALLPRLPDPAQESETVTILQALIARIHLDRPLARKLGWRGVKPSATHAPAWTFRTANARGVYALRFEGEMLDSVNQRLIGQFSFYFFSDEDAQPEGLSAQARALLQRDDLEDLIRDISAYGEMLSDFVLGVLTLQVALAGDGFSMSLDTVMDQRITDEKGETLTRLKLLRLLQPGFSLLINTAQAVVDGESSLSIAASQTPALRISQGELEHDASRYELGVREQVAFGRFCTEALKHLLPSAPLSYKPLKRNHKRAVVHVVSGFLGSGKTTFVAQWLAYLNGRERFTGVLQNEFGEVDLDSMVLSGETKVESLDDGCVCCSLADNLKPGLMRLMETTPAEQFILETTGVASPSYVMTSLHLLDEWVTPGLLITIVDALDLTRHPERLTTEECRTDQIKAADLIVISKADCVADLELEHLKHALSNLNRRAPIMVSEFGSIAFGEIDKLFLKLSDEPGQVKSYLNSAQLQPSLFTLTGPGTKRFKIRSVDSTQDYERETLRFARPIDKEELQKVLSLAGPGLYRAKGVIELKSQGAMLIQWAADHLAIEVPTEVMLEHQERALTLIGKDIAPVEKLLEILDA